MEARKVMCDNCPFGSSEAQRHMRESLRPGRFNQICQDIWRGRIFICHKTADHEQDDSDNYLPGNKDRQCAGAIEFMQRVADNRTRAEVRGGSQ